MTTESVLSGATNKPNLSRLDFNEAPFLVIWEITQACDLACMHCRACAQPLQHPLELTTDEGFRLLGEIRRFGQPLLVLTGGYPLLRPDVFDFIAHGTTLGLRMTMTPSGTRLLTKDNIRGAKKAGLKRMAISLDASTAAMHDAFRQVPGSYDWTMEGIEAAREVGLPLQINTTMTRYNLSDLEPLAAKMVESGISLWSVFFLVPTGRGKQEDQLQPDEYEAVFHFLYDLSKQVPFDIKTTAAPHYRRVVTQRAKTERRSSQTERGTEREAKGKKRSQLGFSIGGGIGRATKGVNDGNGFVFISHTGEIFPSGFLPISAGNVRKQSLLEIYRHSPLFSDLRNPEKLKGKCGRCEYRRICGGSRARAYAIHGDYLASDPFCAYQPRAAFPD
jgi:radical SAM protein